MDLGKELLKEHSKRQAGKIAHYVGDSPTRFKELVHIFLAGPYRITQRAAWPISKCIEAHPRLIGPYFNSMLLMLGRTDVHDSAKRNIVRLLQFVDIPNRYKGLVADRCFTFLNATSEPIAVRVFSMTVLANISKDEPDLKKELRIILEHQLPYASAAFISRARKILKAL